MSRGPLPSVGLDAALPVATARGHVMFFRRMRGSTADLMVSGGGILGIIRIQKSQRLHGTVADIEAEFSGAIDLLRIHPAGGPVSRELWPYSRYGGLRYFRVEDEGLTELGADGKVLPVVTAVPARSSRSGKKNLAVQKPVPAPESMAGPVFRDEARELPEQPAAAGSPVIPAPAQEKPAWAEEPVSAESPEGQGA
jgi:hypothetical protein